MRNAKELLCFDWFESICNSKRRPQLSNLFLNRRYQHRNLAHYWAIIYVLSTNIAFYGGSILRIFKAINLDVETPLCRSSAFFEVSAFSFKWQIKEQTKLSWNAHSWMTLDQKNQIVSKKLPFEKNLLVSSRSFRKPLVICMLQGSVNDGCCNRRMRISYHCCVHVIADCQSGQSRPLSSFSLKVLLLI